jgi:hypothetical protein
MKLAATEEAPGGKGSQSARDLKGQIAAAKFQQEQMQTSSQPEKFFGVTRASNSAPSGDMSDLETAASIQSKVDQSLDELRKERGLDQ